MMFFSKSAESFLKSGNLHLEYACDVKHDLSAEQLRKQLQNVVDDFSKAMDWISEKERRGEIDDEFVNFSGWLKSGKLLPWVSNSPILGLGGLGFRANKAYFLAKRAWANFLAGQYDKSLEDLNVSESFYRLAHRARPDWMYDIDFLKARLCAEKGNYEESLTIYEKILSNTWNREFGNAIVFHARREKTFILYKLGRLGKIEESIVWMSLKHPVLGVSRWESYYVQDFEERVQKETQEALFPGCPKNRIYFNFLIMLKNLDASPPILRVRNMINLENVTLEIAKRYHFKDRLDYMDGLSTLAVSASIFGIIFMWLATCEQVSKFIKEMRAQRDFGQLECFALTRDEQGRLVNPLISK